MVVNLLGKFTGKLEGGFDLFNRGILIKNGKILTPFEIIEGNLLIKENKIVEIGDIECSGDCTVINARGKSVLPAFIDAHTHTIFEGAKLEWLDLSNITRFKDLLRALDEAKKVIKPGDWIIGHSWDESKWFDEPRYPTIKDLDEISKDHPIFIRRIDGHMGVLNSKALELLNVPKKLRGFELDKDGKPTGIVKEDALSYVDGLIREKFLDYQKAIKNAFRKLLELGIASVHDFVNPIMFNALQKFLEENKFLYRNTLYFWAEYAEKLIDLGFKTGFGNSFIKISGIKIMMDGSIGARTAALREPYADDPNERGVLLHSSEDLRELIKKAEKVGLQLAVHAIGDRAIDAALEAFKYSAKAKKLRHRVEHFEIVHEEHIRIVKKIGLTLSMQPNFVANWQTSGGLYERRLRRERVKIMNPFKSLFSANIIVGFGSDCMPLDPLYGIWAALNHPIESERLSLLEAIRGYTYNSAYLEFSEEFKGAIKKNYLADVIILRNDITKIDAKDILDVKVEKIIIDGKLYNL